MEEDSKIRQNEQARQKQAKAEMTKLMSVVIENSTAVPFKWYANNFMCFYCGCPFIDSAKLTQHTTQEHKDFKLSNTIKWLLGKSDVKFDITNLSCKQCLMPMSSLTEFVAHAAESHGWQINKNLGPDLLSFKLSDDGMKCLECEAPFMFFGTLLTHNHKLHGKKLKGFLCEICGQSFPSSRSVDRHVKTRHLSYKCEICAKSFASTSALRHHNEKLHTRLKCSKCPELFSSRYLRKRHLALVHDDRSVQFNCEHCSKIFADKSRLVLHRQRVHLKERKLACDICGFKVFNKDMLTRHMVKHDNSRPFECDLCKKSFQRKSTLKFHRRIHTDDRRYECAECRRSFIQTTSLKLHMKLHHSIANESTSWDG